MLFEINKEFDISIALASSENRRVLEQLFVSHATSTHFLFIHSSQFSSLAESEDYFSEAARSALHDIITNTQDYHALTKKVAFKVVLKNEEPFASDPAKGGWSVPLSFFYNNMIDKLCSANIVGENIDDSTLFTDLFLQAYLAVENDLLKFKNSYKLVGGGGSTTARHINQVQTDQFPISLVICDSDKIAPSQSIQGTASGCKTAFDPSRSIIQLYILDSHESENVVPDEILKGVVDEERLTCLYSVISHSEGDLRSFVDLKNGTKLRKLFSLPSEHKTLWQPIIDRFNEDNVGQCCVDSCAEDSSSNCKCIVTPGLGRSNLLRAVVENIQSIDISQIEFCTQNQQYIEMIKIGRMVFDFTIASPYTLDSKRIN